MIDESLMFRVSALYPKPHYEFTPEVLAFHEAGHAVVQKALGYQLKKTAIDRNKLCGISLAVIQTPLQKDKIIKGSSIQELPLEIRSLIYRRAACKSACISMAGEIAERIFMNLEVKGIVLSNSRDSRLARIALRSARLSALSAYPDRLAKDILKKSWSEVESIASELLERGAINWNEK